MSYSKRQKKLILSMASRCETTEMDDFYAIVKPKRKTIEKWRSAEDSFPKTGLCRICSWIRNHLALILWTVSEAGLLILVTIVSTVDFILAMGLFNTVIPLSGDMEHIGSLLGSGFWLLGIAIAFAFVAALLAYLFKRKGRKNKGFKRSALFFIAASLVSVGLYIAFVWIQITSSVNPISIIISAIYFATIGFSYLLFMNGFGGEGKHDGYAQCMRLVTMLSLVVTIMLSLFGFLDGDTFQKKLDTFLS